MIIEMAASALISTAALNLPSRGSSAAARFVAEQTTTGLNQLKHSHAFGLPADELRAVYAECRSANWDGFQAEPISAETYQIARQLLQALPLGTATPAIGAEPDGHLTMEWYHSQRRTLSISISPTNELHYAALIGPRRAYGTELFFGELPEPIMTLIHRITTT